MQEIRDLHALILAIQGATNELDRLQFQALALCSEAGEAGNVVKKLVYYPLPECEKAEKFQHLQDELCDVLYHLTALAIESGITLEELIVSTICKHTQSLEKIKRKKE